MWFGAKKSGSHQAFSRSVSKDTREMSHIAEISGSVFEQQRLLILQEKQTVPATLLLQTQQQHHKI